MYKRSPYLTLLNFHIVGTANTGAGAGAGAGAAAGDRWAPDCDWDDG